MRKIQFRDLDRMLLDHGFIRDAVHSHALYRHARTKTTITLPLRGRSDRALPMYVAAVRRSLEEAGLVTREDFEQELFSLHQNGTAVNRGS
jgi:predicted RNA binding protein YcfA (HicA-like mRNA interferase family)